MTQEHEESCTIQQAFYKVRQAIAQIQQLEEKTITPHSDLEALFPRNERRAKISKVEGVLDVRLYALSPKTWTGITLPIVLLVSPIGLFINWKYALASFGITATLMNLTTRFGREFNVVTVGELTRKMVRQNYVKSRRNPLTINRKETATLISEIFIVKKYEGRARTPFYLYSALILFAGLAGFWFYWNKNNEKNKIEYVTHPAVGDIYNMSKDENYTTNH
ncbi:MAG: hypothetical protein ABUT20_47455, partial [Bacteroidota bacterium]